MFSSDDSKVLLCDIDYKLVLLDPESGSQAQSQPPALESDETLRLLDTKSWNELFSVDAVDVLNYTLSPDGRYVIASRQNGSMQIWDTSNGRSLTNYSPFSIRAVSMAIDSNSDCSQISTTFHESPPRIQNTGSTDLLYIPSEDSEIYLTSVALSPDGNMIALSSGKSVVRVWDLSLQTEIQSMDHAGFVNSVVFSPDGTQVLTAASDGSITIWEAKTGKAVHTYSQAYEVTCAQYSTDGKKVITASTDGFARVWEISSGQEVLQVGPHDDEVVSACFSQDGQYILTASFDRSASLWSSADGSQKHVFDLNPNDVTLGNAFSAVTGSMEEVKDGSWPLMPFAHYSPDGDRIVTSTEDGDCILWDASTLQELHTFESESSSIMSVSFSPDGLRLLAGLEHGGAILFSSATGDVLSSIEIGIGVDVVDFGSDGKQVAIATESGEVLVYESSPWNLKDLPPVAGSFASLEDKFKACFMEWARQEYARKRSEP